MWVETTDGLLVNLMYVAYLGVEPEKGIESPGQFTQHEGPIVAWRLRVYLLEGGGRDHILAVFPEEQNNPGGAEQKAREALRDLARHLKAWPEKPGELGVA